MNRFLSYIPGFRSGILWKKVLSCFFHFAILIVTLIILISDTESGITPTDRLIEKITILLTGILLFVPTYILITNTFNIRNKLPFFRKHTLAGAILGIITTAVLTFVSLGIGYVILENNYSPQYKEVLAQERKAQKEKQLALEKAKEKEREEKRKQEEERKQKSEVKPTPAQDKQSQQQGQAIAKADATKKPDPTPVVSATPKPTSTPIPSKKPEPAKTTTGGFGENDKGEISNGKPLPGYKYYIADGFKIQIPLTWQEPYSQNLYDEKKTHYLTYMISNTYDTTITIKPFDKTEDYEQFARIDCFFTAYGDIQKIKVKNADIAFMYKNKQNDITELSVYKIAAFKGNLCYVVEANQRGVDESLGKVYIDQYRKEIKQYWEDIENMFPTFELDNDPIDFTTILGNQ